MTGGETRAALSSIALAKAREYSEKLSGLDKNAKTERKALLISQSFAENCAMFVNIEYDGQYYEMRKSMLFRDKNKERAEFEMLPVEKQESSLVYGHADIMARRCLLDHRLEENGDVEHNFESRIIIGVLSEILGEWRNWCESNGVKL